jgi:hypothetical protein
MSNPVQSTEVNSEQELADFIYETHNYTDCKETAALLWPRIARIAELESNERAYEEIIGPMTYREVADRIRELESELASCRTRCEILGSVSRGSK